MKLVIQDTVRDGKKGALIEGQCTISDLTCAISALISALAKCGFASNMEAGAVAHLLLSAIDDGLAADGRGGESIIVNLAALRGGGDGGGLT